MVEQTDLFEVFHLCNVLSLRRLKLADVPVTRANYSYLNSTKDMYTVSEIN